MAMRTLVFVLATLFVSSSLAIAAVDPRNTGDYRMIFDLEARGSSDLVDGYGAYLQIYSDGGTSLFRYCENFDGKGLNGRPNPARERMKLVPVGTADPTAYWCRDFTPTQISDGQALIKLGDRSLFAMKSARWSDAEGGEILFQFAKRLPLIGSPTYRTLRIRAVRDTSNLDYVVEAVLPRTGVFPFHFTRFAVSGSGLGLPNGITAVTLNPTERGERAIDLDLLEGPIKILKHAKKGGSKISLSR